MSGNRPGFRSYLCGFDDLAALVVAAVGADRVRSPCMLAVGAGLDLDQGQGQMRPAPSPLLFGELDLGQCHEAENVTLTEQPASGSGCLVGVVLGGGLVGLQRL